MQLAKALILGPTPKLMTNKEQTHANTYVRMNLELNKVEMMGYAGGNKSTHTNNPSYFKRKTREDSVFGLNFLCMNTACVMPGPMDPYTVIEHIPVEMAKIDIAIYHVYGSNFKMNNKF